MKKSKLFCFIFIVTVLLAISPSLNAQSKRARKFIVSFDRFGSVKIGMTASQAAKVLGVRVTRDAGYEGGNCYYTSPKSGFKDIAFMMSGRRIARIDINSKEYATDKGAKIGDTEARIKRLYKGMYKVYQNKYVDYAHDIEVEMKGGKFSIIFETDGKRVVSYRVGRPEQVGYVEGCS
jgi:outer membrane protein assembly factor BamE (lipoprotein component of BamABCDE complex)